VDGKALSQSFAIEGDPSQLRGIAGEEDEDEDEDDR
jgi:hypothetical protein